jgi:hypothetical protein
MSVRVSPEPARRYVVLVRIRETHVKMAAFFVLIYIVVGYGCSKDEGLTLENIPRYPHATEVESINSYC